MQVIKSSDLEAVSGAGVITVSCTGGTDGGNCTATLEFEMTAEEFGDFAFGIYDTWVDWATDGFQWIDDTWSGFWY